MSSNISLREKKAELRRYWDKHPITIDSVPFAAGTAESFEAIYANWSATIDEMRLAFLEQCRGKKVLEVGCGIGKDARFLTENGINYTGLDYSLRSLNLAMNHFALRNLPQRLTNGDATDLPFADGSFDLVMSIGVLHHIPDTRKACREAIRVTKPGGSLRIMFYHRHSWHYFLVNYIVRPLIWLMLRLPALERALPLAPEKYKRMYEVIKEHGFDRERILAISADTSFAGKDNFVPVTKFFTRKEMMQLFAGLANYQFSRRDLKYFPIPVFRRFVESRFGFFLTMTAQKQRLGCEKESLRD